MQQVVSWGRQRLFQWVHGNNLVYNQCWEDPRLDRVAFQIQPTDNMLVLTSAGCNSLDYLLDDPQHIDAVDMNPRQNALLELKKAGIKTLDFQDFFAFFGQGFHLGAEKIYRQSLRPLLPDFARGYWDKNIRFFEPNRVSPGFYFRGTAGWVARLMGEYIGLKGLRAPIRLAFAARDLDQQKAIYHQELKPYFWNDFLRWFTRRGATMSALGVPRSQFIQIENFYAGGMAQFIEDCLDYVFTKLSLRDNYFYHLYLFGYYSKECSPRYLHEKHFKTLKDRVDRIETHNQSILNFLNTNDKPIHKATLLDHMDWLYQNHYEVLRDQWNALITHSTEATRILWRSASPVVDFIDPIPLIDGRNLGQALQYDKALANELHQKDRVHTYASFYITQVQPT